LRKKITSYINYSELHCLDVLLHSRECVCTS